MKTSEKAKKRQLGLFFSIAVFLLTVVLFWAMMQDLSQNSVQRQRLQLQDALERGIITCYTLEGRYPESLDYLKKNYPLHYNEELFFVDYQIQGANMLPDITIIERRSR